MKKTIKALLIIIIVQLLIINAQTITYAPSPQATKTYCRELYFVNAIHIVRSTINETLSLETPVNITFHGINQSSELVVKRNVVFSNVTGSYVFNVSINGSFYGYFIQKVNMCYPDPKRSASIISNALRDPTYKIDEEEAIPKEIVDEYVREPHRKVVEIVKPKFEEWFTNFHGHKGITIGESSKLGLAVSAALFIYGQYFIKYDEGALPRTMDEVIESRKGDCDDMSRILVELLNAYDIPAVIAYGYAYIPHPYLENLTLTVGNFTYTFRYAGPHAFVLTYVGGHGWLSLDFLASSLLYDARLGRNIEFVFEGFGRETYVNKTEVEMFEDLHRKILGKQFFTIFEDVDDLLEVERMINVSLGLLKINDNVEISDMVNETTSTPGWFKNEVDIKAITIIVSILLTIVIVTMILLVLLSTGIIRPS